MKGKRLCALASICITLCIMFLHCTRFIPFSQTATPQYATVISYNVQTFFDAVEDGTEFKEFKGDKSRWTAQKYTTRLERLKQTLFTAGEKSTGKKDCLPDIAVLQEVEGNRVVEDFCKQLPVQEAYPYALCPPLSHNAAFTTVLLSKYPIEDFFVHHIHTDNSLSLRPLIEAAINMGTKNKPIHLTVFSVHWKSKSGNSESEAVRRMQEAHLVQKIAEHRRKKPHTPFIVCGDFNQPLEEFEQINELAVCWNFETYKTAVESGLQPDGSYYFQDKWEKIDHIFYDNGTDSERIKATAFFVLHESPLIDNGKPCRYNVITGTGYSDHLPLVCTFELHH